jgi:hypothetical protein
MTDRDIEKFAVVMAALSECFDKEISEKKLEVYFAALQELTIEQVAAAAKWLMRYRTITGTFPLIAEFYQALEQVEGQGGVEDRAELAWRKLVWAIKNHGYYASVCFDDPVIHAVVDAMGGWLKISGDDPDWWESELKWRQKDFVALYRALAKQNAPAKPYLVGFVEASNSGQFDDFVPNLVRIAGSPGHMQALPTKRPEALPERPNCKPALSDIVQKTASSLGK